MYKVSLHIYIILFQRNTGIQHSLSRVLINTFFRADRTINVQPPWLPETFSIYPLQTLNWFWRNSTSSKNVLSDPSIVPWFWMHLSPLVCNGYRWMDFDETQHESISQYPLPRLCFSGRSVNKEGHLGQWLSEINLSSVQHLNGLWRLLTESQVTTNSQWHLPSLWDFFRTFQSTEIATLVSDLVRHFSRSRIHHVHCWVDFNKTWKSKMLLASYAKFALRTNKDGIVAVCLSFAKYFLLLALKGFQRLQKQATKVLYQVGKGRGGDGSDPSAKIAILASDLRRHFRRLQQLNGIWWYLMESKYTKCLLPSLYVWFLLGGGGRSDDKDWPTC